MQELKCQVGYKIGICIENEKGEFSYYTTHITKEKLEGGGLDDWFLTETTGFDIEEDNERN